MKIVIRTVVFHFVCILFFASVYYYFKADFQAKSKKEEMTVVDFLFISTTIQSGVGISDTVFPLSTYIKITMIIQQIVMIMAHVFTLYVFNL